MLAAPDEFKLKLNSVTVMMTKLDLPSPAGISGRFQQPSPAAGDVSAKYYGYA